MAASDSRSGLGSYDNPRELAAMAASGNNDNHMVDNHIGDNPLLNADILWICKGNVNLKHMLTPTPSHAIYCPPEHARDDVITCAALCGNLWVCEWLPYRATA